MHQRQCRMSVSESQWKTLISLDIIKGRNCQTPHLLHSLQQKISKSGDNFKQEINEALKVCQDIINAVCDDLRSVELSDHSQSVQSVERLYESIVKSLLCKLQTQTQTQSTKLIESRINLMPSCRLCKHHEEKEKLEEIKQSLKKSERKRIPIPRSTKHIKYEDYVLDEQIQESLGRRHLVFQLKPTSIGNQLQSILKSRPTLSSLLPLPKLVQFLQSCQPLIDQILIQLQQSFTNLKLKHMLPCILKLITSYHQYSKERQREYCKGVEVGTQTWSTIAELSFEDRIRDLKESVDLKKQIIEILEGDLREVRKELGELRRCRENAVATRLAEGRCSSRSVSNKTKSSRSEGSVKGQKERNKENKENGRRRLSKKRVTREEHIGVLKLEKNKTSGVLKRRQSNQGTQETKVQPFQSRKDIALQMRTQKSRFSRFSESQSPSKLILSSTTDHFKPQKPIRFSTVQPLPTPPSNYPDLTTTPSSTALPSQHSTQKPQPQTQNPQPKPKNPQSQKPPHQSPPPLASQLPTISQRQSTTLKSPIRQSAIRDSLLNHKLRRTAFSVIFHKEEAVTEIAREVVGRARNRKNRNKNVGFDREDLHQYFFSFGEANYYQENGRFQQMLEEMDGLEVEMPLIYRHIQKIFEEKSFLYYDFINFLMYPYKTVVGGLFKIQKNQLVSRQDFILAFKKLLCLHKKCGKGKQLCSHLQTLLSKIGYQPSLSRFLQLLKH